MSKFSIRGGSRTAETFKMERFVIIVNDWNQLTIITKRSILTRVWANRKIRFSCIGIKKWQFHEVRSIIQEVRRSIQELHSYYIQELDSIMQEVRSKKCAEVSSIMQEMHSYVQKVGGILQEVCRSIQEVCRYVNNCAVLFEKCAVLWKKCTVIFKNCAVILKKYIV